MSFFQNPRNVHVDRLNIDVNNTSVGVGSSQGPREVLYSHIAPGALYDSSERCDAPKCHPETRKAVQADILSWITHGRKDAEPRRIVWLTGPAGTGKTAIMGSIAELCKDKDLLAATFFFSSFSGSADRRSKRCLVATLAHQLIQLRGLGRLRDRMLEEIGNDGSLFTKSLHSQLEALVLKPLRERRKPRGKLARILRALFGSRRGSSGGLLDFPILIIIDGVDEISAEISGKNSVDNSRHANEVDQVEVLSALLQLAKDPASPFLILIASRPERAIREFFSDTANGVTRELFLDEKYRPDDDIRLFLQSNFADIRRRYSLPSSWPSEDTIQRLVKAASGQFIYAATVVRFLRTGNVSPDVRLKFIETLKCDENINPFESMDNLYILILKSSPKPELAIQWISVIVNHPNNSALFVKQLLQDSWGQAEHLLENLASLIRMPEDPAKPYKLYHKSLTDFLEDPRRSGDQFHRAYLRAEDELLMPCIRRVFLRRIPALMRNRKTSSPTS